MFKNLNIFFKLILKQIKFCVSKHSEDIAHVCANVFLGTHEKPFQYLKFHIKILLNFKKKKLHSLIANANL